MKQQWPWEHKKLTGATNGPGNDMKNYFEKVGTVLMNKSEY